MISLKDSNITDILPEAFAKDAGNIALGYALHRAMNRLLDYSRATSVYAAIDAADDAVLDMLAAELNTQYYDVTLDIAAKRGLVKNTLVWYTKAGTPTAIEELVETVFGAGEVKEWFEYGGQPYKFKIITSGDASIQAIEEFENIIMRVKNARSHLEKVEFMRDQEAPEYIGIASIVSISAEMEMEG